MYEAIIFINCRVIITEYACVKCCVFFDPLQQFLGAVFFRQKIKFQPETGGMSFDWKAKECMSERSKSWQKDALKQSVG